MIAEEYLSALTTIGDSGVYWVDEHFKLCVIFLVDLSNLIGVSYEEINIWIFVIIWPLLTVYQTIRILVLNHKIRKLDKIY